MTWNKLSPGNIIVYLFFDRNLKTFGYASKRKTTFVVNLIIQVQSYGRETMNQLAKLNLQSSMVCDKSC